MTSLQEKLDEMQNEHLRTIEGLHKSFEKAEDKHREELEHLKGLMGKKAEDSQAVEKQEGEIRELKTTLDEIQKRYETALSELQREQTEHQEVVKERLAETEALKEEHQKDVSELHRELERVREELANVLQLHEEEVRDLMMQMEENAADFEVERDRLLFLQDELSEQLAMKESYLQDVQEEEEDPNRSGAHKDPLVCKMLNFSGAGDEEDEVSQLKAKVEDLQAQNTMFQDELTFLRNVKTELESDLQHKEHEFQVEKEELEFKIDELRMTKDDTAHSSEPKTQNSQPSDEDTSQHDQVVKDLKDLHETELHELEKRLRSEFEANNEVQAQEVESLKNLCEQLSAEKTCAVEEYTHTQGVLQSFEAELGEKTGDFIKQYNAMKDQTAHAVKDLEERLRVACSERDNLMGRIENLEQEVVSLQDLKVSAAAQKEEILSQLQKREATVTELNEMLDVESSAKKDLQKSLENAHAELAKLKEDLDLEKSEKCSVSYSLASVSKDKTEMQCKLDELESALAEKESIETLVNEFKGKLSLVTSEKDELCSRLNAVEAEHTALQEKEREAQELISGLKSESINTSIEETEKLKQCLRDMSDEQHVLKSDKNAMETKLSEAYGHIINLCERNNWDVCADGKDIPALLDALVALVAQEKLDLTGRTAELAEELERLEQHSTQTRVELQAHVEDLSREKSLLKGNLDEVVSDVEALQKDLTEMKTVNEKMRAENQELLAQIAEASEKLSAVEHDGKSGENEPSLVEIKHDGKSGENETSLVEIANERKELKQQLAEKESLLEQLRQDIASLQVSGSMFIW